MPFNPDAYLASKAKEPFNPDTYLAKKKNPSLLARGIEAEEKYLAAPVRAAVGAAQHGNNPLTAAQAQFGQNPQTAPTGQQLAEYGFGLQPGGMASKVVGAGLNIATDPLTYAPVGTALRGAELVGSGLKNAGMGALRSSGGLINTAQKMGAKVLEGMAAKHGVPIGILRRTLGESPVARATIGGAAGAYEGRDLKSAGKGAAAGILAPSAGRVLSTIGKFAPESKFAADRFAKDILAAKAAEAASVKAANIRNALSNTVRAGLIATKQREENAQ